MHTMKVLSTIFGLGLAFLVAASSTAPAQGDTSGKVSVESKSVALGVGVSWGDGVLEYRGKKHTFTVEGLSVLDLGVAKVNARGDVKNLKKLEDFNGNYALIGSGAAPGAGTGAALLKNENGVEMALVATGQGVKLSIAQGGVSLKLKQ